MNSKGNKRFKKDFLALRVIVNAWEIIPEVPEDEFDSITYLLLSELYQKSDAMKISKRLKLELENYYGLDFTNDEVKEMTAEVMNWWRKSNGLH